MDVSAEDELRSMLSLFPFRPTSEGPAEMTHYLFLGSSAHARDPSLLHKLGITHVINCAENDVGIEHYASLRECSIECSGFNSSDAKEYTMLAHHDDVLAMVTAIKDSHGVCMLHCQAGVNRSGFLMIALLCGLEHMPLLKAAAWARQQRGRVCTNVGFQNQLLQLAKERNWQLR